MTLHAILRKCENIFSDIKCSLYIFCLIFPRVLSDICPDRAVFVTICWYASSWRTLWFITYYLTIEKFPTYRFCRATQKWFTCFLSFKFERRFIYVKMRCSSYLRYTLRIYFYCKRPVVKICKIPITIILCKIYWEKKRITILIPDKHTRIVCRCRRASFSSKNLTMELFDYYSLIISAFTLFYHFLSESCISTFFIIVHFIEIDFYSLLLHSSPLIEISVIAKSDEMRLIIGMEIVGVARNFEFSENLRITSISNIYHK